MDSMGSMSPVVGAPIAMPDPSQYRARLELALEKAARLGGEHLRANVEGQLKGRDSDASSLGQRVLGESRDQVNRMIAQADLHRNIAAFTRDHNVAIAEQRNRVIRDSQQMGNALFEGPTPEGQRDR